MYKAFIANDGKQFRRAHLAIRHEAQNALESHLRDNVSMDSDKFYSHNEVLNYLRKYSNEIKRMVLEEEEARKTPDYTYDEVRDFIVTQAFARTELDKEGILDLCSNVWQSLAGGDSNHFENDLHGDWYHLVCDHFEI